MKIKKRLKYILIVYPYCLVKSIYLTMLDYLKILNQIIKIKFYFILTLIVLFSLYLGRFFNNESVEQAYFWILSSLVQGFSAFFGVIVAILTLRRNSISKKDELIKLIGNYVTPIITAASTIIFSIVAMIFYNVIKNNNLLSQIVLICSFFAIWSIFEIFKILIDSLVEQRK